MKVSPEHNLYLTNVINVSSEIKARIRDIRNEEQVRKWMYTDHLISKEEHEAWLKRLDADKKNIVFIVSIDNNEPLGVLSINSIDKNHEKAEWAYYLTGSARSGLGAVLEFFILDYVFNVLKLKKLNCEVIENNDSVISLHLKFGFQQEGFRKYNIVKNGTRIGVYLLGMTDIEWKENKDKIQKKYMKLFSKYNIVWN